MTNRGTFHKPEEEILLRCSAPKPSFEFSIQARNLQALYLHRTHLLRFAAALLLFAGSASDSRIQLFAQESQAGYGLPALGQSPDVALVETLINDGLPTFALKLCESRLPLHSLDSDAHARWRMLALHAHTAIALQEVDFSNGSDAIETIVQSLEPLAVDAKGTPREDWVHWKKLWCRWVVLQRALAAYLAVPSRESLRDAIIVSIRDVLDEVELLEQSVRSMRAAKGTDIPTSQRMDLRGSLDLLKADLLYQRSQCYPIASDDRMAAASEMLRSLDQALSKLPGDWTHRPALSIARAKAQIQLEQYDAALASLDTLWKQLREASNTSAVMSQYQRTMAAVAMRAARELARWDDVATWLARGGGATSTPELALESFASEIKRGGPNVAERALQLKREIGSRFGPYWEQRADAILVSSGGFNLPPSSTNTPSGSASLEVLRIEVRQLLAAKRWSEAIQKLEQAELAAVREKSVSDAFAFAMQRAAIFESNGQREDAANAFFHAATEYSSQPKAPAAALMSAWLIRTPESTADDEKTKSLLETYQQRLIDTALQWPTSDAANQATLWLEQQYISRDDLVGWIEFWDQKCKEHPQPTSLFSAGATRAALFHLLTKDDWLETPTDDPKNLENALQSFHQTLSSIAPNEVRTATDAWLATLTPAHRWSPSTPLAALPQFPAPNDSLDPDTLAPSDPLGQIAILWFASERISAFAWNESSPDRASVIAQLTRAVSALETKLATHTKSPQPSLVLGPMIDSRFARSMAYYRAAIAGGESDSEPRLAGLAKLQIENKKSLWWLYRTARAMQTSEKHREQAIGLFRQMASGVPAGSEPWLEARARTAQTFRLRGDDAAANQLRDLVFATYPSTEGTWRSRFESK